MHLGSAAFASSAFEKYYDVGKEYLLNGKFDLAIKEFDGALRLSAGNTKVLVERGTAYNGLGKYDLAIGDFTEVIKASPANYLAFNNRGVAYFRKGEFKNALQDLDKALSIDANQSIAYLNHAGVSLCIGEQISDRRAKDSNLPFAKRIEDWLRRSNWKDKYSGHAAVLAAFLYRQDGNTKAAQALIAEALKHTDRLKWPYPALKLLAGKLDDKAVLQEAEDSDYDTTQAHCFIALDFLFKGKRDRARDHLSWIVNHGTRNSVEYWIARGMKN